MLERARSACASDASTIGSRACGPPEKGGPVPYRMHRCAARAHRRHRPARRRDRLRAPYPHHVGGVSRVAPARLAPERARVESRAAGGSNARGRPRHRHPASAARTGRCCPLCPHRGAASSTPAARVRADAAPGKCERSFARDWQGADAGAALAEALRHRRSVVPALIGWVDTLVPGIDPDLVLGIQHGDHITRRRDTFTPAPLRWLGPAAAHRARPRAIPFTNLEITSPSYLTGDAKRHIVQVPEQGDRVRVGLTEFIRIAANRNSIGIPRFAVIVDNPYRGRFGSYRHGPCVPQLAIAGAEGTRRVGAPPLTVALAPLPYRTARHDVDTACGALRVTRGNPRERCSRRPPRSPRRLRFRCPRAARCSTTSMRPRRPTTYVTSASTPSFIDEGP
jgi:hypothetical protein